jgi:putative Mn2+ efflux pump MntP
MTVSILVPLIASLSLDTFAASTAIGIARLSGRTRVRIASTFAAAEAATPLVGFVLGGFASRLGAVADWLAVALLLAVGAWIIREALEDEDEVGEAVEHATAGGRAMIIAALSVSLDELAVGIAIGSLGLPIAPVVLAIGAQALIASTIGLRLGSHLGAKAGARAGVLAGVTLIVVSFWLAGLRLAGIGI